MKKHMACSSALPSVAYVSQSRLRVKGAFVKIPDTRICLICYVFIICMYTYSTWFSRMDWIDEILNKTAKCHCN